MLDVVAVLLTRCAETGRTFWGWTEEEWFHLLGRTQAEFRQHAPAWAGDEVRPYLATHAYLLGSFNEFHRLGSLQRLTLNGESSDATASTARPHDFVRSWSPGATGSARTRTPCCRWWPASCSYSTAALILRSSTPHCSTGSAATGCWRAAG